MIAIDPGVSTGIAISKASRYATLTLSLEDVDAGRLRDLIAQSDMVVYEDFVGYKKNDMRVSAAGFETVRLIGRILEQCSVQKIPVIRRAAQNRIAFLTKAKLMLKNKQVVCYKPTRHEADALAHLLSYEWQLKEAS